MWGSSMGGAVHEAFANPQETPAIHGKLTRRGELDWIALKTGCTTVASVARVAMGGRSCGNGLGFPCIFWLGVACNGPVFLGELAFI